MPQHFVLYETNILSQYFFNHGCSNRYSVTVECTNACTSALIAFFVKLEPHGTHVYSERGVNVLTATTVVMRY